MQTCRARRPAQCAQQGLFKLQHGPLDALRASKMQPLLLAAPARPLVVAERAILAMRDHAASHAPKMRSLKQMAAGPHVFVAQASSAMGDHAASRVYIYRGIWHNRLSHLQISKKILKSQKKS
jgi:hypothetical protein